METERDEDLSLAYRTEEKLEELMSGAIPRSRHKLYQQRLFTELDTIHRLGLFPYFTALSEVAAHACEQGILVGPGRGSVGGSLVCFLSGITEIDPLQHDLVFDRFLNLGGRGHAVVDLDVCSRGQRRIAQYATEHGRGEVLNGRGNKFTIHASDAVTQFGDLVNQIANENGHRIALSDIPFDDPDTYALLATGDTDGVAVIEEPEIREYMTRFRPTCFNDLVTVIAVGRPGTRELAETLLRRKHGSQPWSLPHDSLEAILSSTYGLCLYQEQVMRILHQIGGYASADTDRVRMALTVQPDTSLPEQRAAFTCGADTKGVPGAVAADIFRDLRSASMSTYCKAHAVGLVMTAYRLLWVKAQYRDVFNATAM